MKQEDGTRAKRQRNRIKRIIRESFRRQSVLPNVDIVVVGKSGLLQRTGEEEEEQASKENNNRVANLNEFADVLVNLVSIFILQK